MFKRDLGCVVEMPNDVKNYLFDKSNINSIILYSNEEANTETSTISINPQENPSMFWRIRLFFTVIKYVKLLTKDDTTDLGSMFASEIRNIASVTNVMDNHTLIPFQYNSKKYYGLKLIFNNSITKNVSESIQQKYDVVCLIPQVAFTDIDTVLSTTVEHSLKSTIDVDKLYKSLESDINKLHQNSIYNIDIRPANIGMCPEDKDVTYKLIDFDAISSDEVIDKRRSNIYLHPYIKEHSMNGTKVQTVDTPFDTWLKQKQKEDKYIYDILANTDKQPSAKQKDFYAFAATMYDIISKLHANDVNLFNDKISNIIEPILGNL